MRFLRNREEGIGVVEIIVAMAILSLITVIAIPILTNTLSLTSNNAVRAAAVQLANSQMAMDRAILEGQNCATVTRTEALTKAGDRLRVGAWQVTCPTDPVGMAQVTVRVVDMNTSKTIFTLQSNVRVGDGTVPTVPSPTPTTPGTTPTPTPTTPPTTDPDPSPEPTATAPQPLYCDPVVAKMPSRAGQIQAAIAGLSATEKAECVTILSYSCAAGDTISFDLYNLKGISFVRDEAKDYNRVQRNVDGSNPSTSLRETLSTGSFTLSPSTTHKYYIVGSFKGLKIDDGAGGDNPGVSPKIAPNTNASFRGTENCLRAVDQWGTRSGVTDLPYAFQGERNLTSVPQPPTTVTRMDGMFQNATNFRQNISAWNVANVTSWANFATGSGLASSQIPSKFR